MYIEGSEIPEAIYYGNVIILFSATIFEKHTQMKDIAEELEALYEDRIEVYFVDVDEYPEVAEKFGIHLIPSVGIFTNGTPRMKIEGLHELSFYKTKFDELLTT
ncbi:hypothetical protein KC717_00505 [Candidatus Dojkabacteria bacterium]|uniref:Thioredoxin domain-containing protein n=1 Tax=Candidatus Dojkabacteria bacterium TaxID=2099670 RepID=A0A955RK82_9BACT|nr:hypothetical protein [Candidatus Dojkabacteria bacterium]